MSAAHTILHVAHGYFPEGAGGVESYLRELLTAQRARGRDARLLTGSIVPWPEPGVERLEADGVPIYRVHRDDLFFDHFAKLWHPGIGRLFTALLEEVRPDVVHVHQWIRLTCNLVELCERHGVPAIVTLHDLYTSCPRCFRVRRDDTACSLPLSVASCLDCVPRFGWESEPEVRTSIELFAEQYRAELEMARAVVTSSAATADLIAATTGFARASIDLVPLGYARRFPGGAPPPAPLPDDGEPFRFGYWGNLTVRKGAQVLLEAFRALCASGLPRPAELHLFGRVDTPELEARLRALAAGLPVVFHGRYEYADLAAARLHVAVFPMVCFETHGFVLDEAFELGLPAVVTDIGAIPVRAGRAAVRVPPRDPAALEAALRALLERPALREELRREVSPPGVSPIEHAERLDAVYARARLRGPTGAEPLSDARRAELLLRQRESAQARLYPREGPR